jgi:hypothetical protein
MNWYKIDLTRNQVANGLYEQITRKLQKKVLLSAADRKTFVQLAAFDIERHEPNCSRTIYLSPALGLLSSEILAEGKAESCPPPSESSLEVLVSWDNDEAAWEILRSSSIRA